MSHKIIYAVRIIAGALLLYFLINTLGGYTNFRNQVSPLIGVDAINGQLYHIMYYVILGVQAMIVGLAWIAAEIALRGSNMGAKVGVDTGRAGVSPADVKA